MVEVIVLLMPLTIPAFEMAADSSSRRAAFAVGAVMVLGLAVQLIGVAVYVTVNEWKRTAAGIVAANAWVFVASASPIVYDLEELARGRNLSPWAIRALALPDAALLLLIVLVVTVWFGGWRILQYFRAPLPEPSNLNSRALPVAIVAATVIPILIGFAMSRPLIGTLNAHMNELFNAGLAEQQAGHAVAAEEYYAIVLTSYPSNEYALFNLGVLEQEAGRTNYAALLYEKVLRNDPAFAPARNNMAIMQTRFGFSNLRPQ